MSDIQHLVAEMAALASTEVMEVSLTNAEKRILVDMDTRNVSVQNKFGNQYDHLAKKNVLEITRYVGDTDLAEHTCAIHWENGANGGVIPITKWDLSEDGKILVLWEITNEFTQYSGKLVFAVHFFSVVDGSFTFHSSSDSAAGELGKTLNASDHGQNNIFPSEIEKYIALMNEFSAEIDAKIAAVDAKIAGIDALVVASVESLFIPVTQVEYDALVEAGEVDPNKYYMIKEDN